MPKREIISSPVLDDNSDIAIGLSLPFNGDDDGLFNLNFLSIEQAISNVKNLLLTRKGERINHPQFGTNLQDYLFEPNYESLREKVGTEITDAIEQWLPYIVIKKLEVRVPDVNQGGLIDPLHGILVVLVIGLINDTINEEEIVLEIKEL